MSLEKNSSLLTSRRWSNNDPNNYQIMALVEVAQKIADKSKKEYEKFNRDPDKGEPAYIRGLPPWILEETKGVLRKKQRMEGNMGGARNNAMAKSNGFDVSHKITVSGQVLHQAEEEAPRN